MENFAREMSNIVKRYNQALTLTSKRELATEIDKIHSRMSSICQIVTPENGYSVMMCNLSMELLLDIRMGRPTTVDKKLHGK
ncbi:hypothetical protein MLA66_004624 [Salmonella enterica]|nr:hypothetical protein [Salmonella enterica]EEO3567253.1 hypothetical protein [Salmonella enterica subsp. enterica serovar Poona]HBI5523758.1 hypothetical protein [Salmonella enterica subsp. enterica serovar Welikade]EEH1294983.1 hypothetical protein [Salmonella enterica]EHZ8150642.1 hypothetical protein [Salmonella enterica]